MENFDVIIIGKGPAGISASLYTVRAGLKTLVIGKDLGSLEKTDKIENYYGFENPVSGRELLETGIKQAKRIGADVRDGEVTALGYEEMFTVKTADGEYASRAVLIASGQPPRRPNIPGIDKFEGKGVSYCTTCDGFFFKNKKVGVLGNGSYAVQEASELLPFTKDITVFTNGSAPELPETAEGETVKYNINSSKVISLSGDAKLEEIVLENAAEKIDGLFVAGGSASSVDFAVKLGISTEKGAIITDENQQTSLDGVFAAGDCTGGLKQVSAAVGEGAVAGRGIINFLRRKK